jgi:hypothetical protein
MHRCLIVLVVLAASACSDSTGVSSADAGLDISGGWVGTLTSSNYPPEQIVVNLSQSGRHIEGTWRSEVLFWAGQIIGDVDGSTFSGQMTFRGTVSGQTVCTGLANFAGSANAALLSWSSPNGFVSDSCSAPLPVAVRIDLHR